MSLRDISERKAHDAMLMRDHDALEGRVVERTADLVEINKRLLDEITQHRRTEAELRRARGELVQTAKLATIGELSAGINHEINQPLTAIRFYADNALVFLDRAQLPELRGNLVHISALTDRIGRIVTEPKLFARQSSGQSVPQQLPSLMSHEWPGNVQELQNAAERYVLLGDGQDIHQLALRGPEKDSQSLRCLIESELKAFSGNISQATEALGTPRKTLDDKVRKYGLSRKNFRSPSPEK